MIDKRALILRLRRYLLSLPVLIAAIALALYALAGFFLAPYLVSREIPRFAGERLKAKAAVAEVRINPFLLTAEVKGFQLREQDDRPVFAFDRLFVDLETSSLFRWAWTVKEVSLEGPRIDLDIDPAGELNLVRLANRLVPPDQKAPPKEEPPPRLLLYHLGVARGRIAITDRSDPTPAQAQLDPISFELKDLSTLPGHRGDHIVSARLTTGGTLAWRGQLTLQPIAAEGEVQVKDLKVATVWRFLQDELRMDEPAGSMDLGFRYGARYAGGAFQVTAENVGVRAAGLVVKPRGAKAPILALAEATLSGGAFDLAQRRLSFSQLALRQGELGATRDQEGQFDWQRLAAPAAQASPGPQAAPAAPGHAAPPWRLAIDAVKLEQIGLRYTDAARPQPLLVEVGRMDAGFTVGVERGAQIDAKLGKLAISLGTVRVASQGAETPLAALETVSLTGGDFDLGQRKFSVAELAVRRGQMSAHRDESGALDWQGPAAGVAERAAPAPAQEAAASAHPWQLQVDAVRLEEIALRATDATRSQPLLFEVDRFDAGFSVNVEGGDALSAKVGNLAVDIARASVAQRGAQAPLVTLDTASLAGGSIDLGARSIAIQSVKLRGGQTLATREPDGNLNLAQALAARRDEPPPDAPFAVAIDSIELAGHRIAAADRGFNPPIRYELENVGVKVGNFASESGKPLRFELAARLGQGGNISSAGTFDLTRNRAEGRLGISRLALLPLEPLLAPHVTLKLASGSASADGRFNWELDRARGNRLAFKGGMRIDGLLFNDAAGERFAASQQVAASGVALDLRERRLAVEEVRLVAPAGKLVINKDRTTNLATIMREPAKASPPAQDKPAAAPEQKFAVTVDRVRLEKGELDFADLSLVLPFSTRIQELNGTITGLASEPGSRASVKLDGRVDDHGLARIDGTINPFEPKAHTDLTVAFRNVMMTPLSAYSATFAGRRIASGRLTLDLQYKLTNSELQGENKVVLEQFTLGERVESPSAMDLPLDLAIALLTDSDGKIDVAVPVRGNVDHPEFSYNHLVWQAIRNLLTRIVTAPFRALASLFGGSGENLDDIAFDAGSARLLPPEREKLVRLVETLKKRPQLRLVVQGRYHTVRDGATLRDVAARRALAERLGSKVAPGEDPGPVAYDNARTQRALEAMLAERGGTDAVPQFVAGFEKEKGREAKRANPVLALVGRGSQDRELYEAIFRRVAELQPLPPKALEELALARGAVITKQVAGAAGIGAARVGQKAPEAVSGAQVTSKLSLDVAKTTQ